MAKIGGHFPRQWLLHLFITSPQLPTINNAPLSVKIVHPTRSRCYLAVWIGIARGNCAIQTVRCRLYSSASTAGYYSTIVVSPMPDCKQTCQFTVSRVKQPEGSKAATFKVTDADGDVRKDIYTATDIQKVDADRIQRSPITIAPRSAAPRRPRTRQRAAVSLRQGAPRRSARLAGR